jgi:hypothetical protein
MTGRVLTAGLVAVAVIAVGCDDVNTRERSTTPTVPTSIAADDCNEILEELNRRAESLYAAPDLSRVRDYCVPRSESARGIETQLGDYINRGEHIEGQKPFEVLEIIDAATTEDGRAAEVMFVVAPDTGPAARIVNAAGDIVDTLSMTTTKSKGEFTLAWVGDPVLPWRVEHIENLGPVP